MEIKKCLCCNEDIVGKRYDAKFCGNTCKAKHWEGKRLPPDKKEVKSLTSLLRGVLGSEEKIKAVSITTNSNEPVFETVEQRVNFARILLVLKHSRLLDVKKKAEMELIVLQGRLKQVASQNGAAWVVGLTGAGALIANKPGDKDSILHWVGAAVGLMTGLVVQDATKQRREEERKRQLTRIELEIQMKKAFIQNTDGELKIVGAELKAIPEYHFVKRQIPLTTQKIIVFKYWNSGNWPLWLLFK